jgi:hypothetical protein
MQAAQERQKAYANRGRRDVKFATGDAVMLSTTNVKFKATGKAKFMPRFMGPFIITEVYGPQDRDGNVVQVTACKVKLPDLMKIHPVFHVSLLKHFKSDGEPVPRCHTTKTVPPFGRWTASSTSGWSKSTRKDTSSTWHN